MKNFIYVLLFIGVFSCAKQEDEFSKNTITAPVVEEVLPIDVEPSIEYKLQLNYGSGKVYEIEIDGCQFLCYYYYESGNMIHKPTCTNVENHTIYAKQ